jgi:ribosome-binding protein aMBF1 (putative translation factor)
LLIEATAEGCAAAGWSPEDLCGELRERGYCLARIEEDGSTVPSIAGERLREFQNLLAVRSESCAFCS